MYAQSYSTLHSQVELNPLVDGKNLSLPYSTPQSTKPQPRPSALLPSSLLVGFFALGASCAAAHHFFNAYLNGRDVSVFEQAWAIRVGTALAFGLKSLLVAGVGIAYTQRAWLTASRKELSLPGLDALLSPANDPKTLMNGDIYRSAKSALLLAVFVWIIPLSAIFTPATLRVVPSPNATATPCDIPSADLTNPAFRALSLFDSNQLYLSPSALSRRIAVKALVSGNYSQWDSGCGESCSYTVQFNALSLNCTPQTDMPSNLGTGGIFRSLDRRVPDTDTGTDLDILEVEWLEGYLWCLPWNSTYKLSVSYKGPTQTVELLSEVKNNPFSKPDPGRASFPSTDPERSSLAALQDAIFDLIRGGITQDQSGVIGFGTGTPTNAHLASNFAEQNAQGGFTFKNVKQGLEQLMRDTSISLFSLNLAEMSTTCTRSGDTNIYNYSPLVLLASYGGALAAALVALVVGFHAIKANGGGSDSSFTSVLAATRNQTLDHKLANREVLPLDALEGVKLRYGRAARGGRDTFGTSQDLLQ